MNVLDIDRLALCPLKIGPRDFHAAPVFAPDRASLGRVDQLCIEVVCDSYYKITHDYFCTEENRDWEKICADRVRKNLKYVSLTLATYISARIRYEIDGILLDLTRCDCRDCR